MKKDKKIEKVSVNTPDMEFESLPQETDQIILDQINKRNEENLALKKLLDNLNTSFPEPKIKSTKR